MRALSEYFKRGLENYTIVNPDALNGTTGWTADVGTGIATRANGYFPSGQVFWGSTQVNAGAYQDVVAAAGVITEELIDSGSVILKLQWYHGSYNDSDQNRMLIDFFDGSPGSQITVTDARTIPFVAGPQELLAEPAEIQTLLAVMPPLTRTIRIYQRMFRTNGTDNNGYISGITLQGYAV